MSDETIWLRGGPLNDEYIAWRGGNEVERDFVIDLAVAPAPGIPGAAYGPATALHRRSVDDPRRFDFVGFVDHGRRNVDKFKQADQMLTGQRWTIEQAERLIDTIRKGVG